MRAYDGVAELVGQALVELRRGLAGDRGDLRGQQRQQDAVLVRGPDTAVQLVEGGAGRFLAAEGAFAGEQPGDEPLEAHRDLHQLAAQARGHAVDDRGGHQGLADHGLRVPAGRGAVQVIDGDGEVVVRVHQPAVRGDDAVAVGVGVVAGGDVERGRRRRRTSG